MTFRFLVATLLGTVACAAHAQPANDDIANAEVIAALPFADSEAAIATATTVPGDPVIPCVVTGGAQALQTVWYRYTAGASTEYLTISTAGSTYDTVLALYEGAPGALRLVTGGCNDNGISVGSDQARIVGARLLAGTPYYLEVARAAGTSPTQLTLAVTPAVIHQVTTAPDTNDGVCDAHCSLREAIGAANVDPGVVLVPAGTYTLSRLGVGEDSNDTGDLDVRAGMAIYGAGSLFRPGQPITVIDGLEEDRMFHLDPAGTNRASVTFGDVHLIDGWVEGAGGDGGGVLAGGTANFAAFERVTIDNSLAEFDGGGVHSLGFLQFRYVTITSNFAGGQGGGISNGGGANVSTELAHSRVSGNRTFGGGGIRTSANLRIDNSSIANNSAAIHGGGVLATDAASVSIRSSTIAFNMANSNGDATGDGGGIRLENSGAAAIVNSIVSDNVDLAADPIPDCSKASPGVLITSYSVLRQTVGGCVFAGPGDATQVNPVLHGENDSGGLSWTIAIDVGPARDTGDPAGCTDATGLPIINDQRGPGFPRISNGRCDKGAYEFQVAPTATIPGTPDLAAASDSGLSDTDDITNDGTPAFTGTCATGDTIEILIDGAAILPSQVCAGGTYAITPTLLLADDTYDVGARATFGTVAPSTGTLTLVVDTVAAPPAFLGPTSGGQRPYFFGNQAEAGALVTVGTLLTPYCSQIADAGGNWTCLSTVSINFGSAVPVLATQLDIAGNESEPAQINYTVIDALFDNGFE